MKFRKQLGSELRHLVEAARARVGELPGRGLVRDPWPPSERMISACVARDDAASRDTDD